MFLTLLAVSLVLSIVIAAVMLGFLSPSLRGILNRVVGPDASEHWYRFALFALYITSVGYGVEASRLEQYIHRLHKDDLLPNLDFESWVYEVYQVIERVLSSLACGVITIFIIALVSLVILRIFEIRRGKTDSKTSESGNA